MRIAPDVRLGRDVKLHAFINLYGCEIGDESKIGAFVEIQKGVRIGRRMKVSSHSFICEGVTMEDDCFVGHGVMFTNDKSSIGSNATILCGVTMGARVPARRLRQAPGRSQAR